MTGLKSGSGDDLWGDDDGDDADDSGDTDASAADREATDVETAEDETEATETDSAVTDNEQATEQPSETGRPSETGQTSDPDQTPEPSERRPSKSATGAGAIEDADGSNEQETTSSSPGADDSGSVIDVSAIESESPAESQSYIVRRAVQDKSVQFERDERLTFFVHDDVAEGERDLITELQSALGRDVPKFDVREAVYRAALRNPDDVLEELLEMGYSIDEE